MPASSSRELFNELLQAIKSRDLVRCEELIARGCDVVGSAKWSPLVNACTTKRIDICRALVDAGAPANQLDELPLTAAAISGSADLCRYLISAGADCRHVNAAGRTALHSVLSAEACLALIDSGTPVDVRSADGRTALLSAVKYRRTPVAKVLVEAGADITIAADGLTPFQLAVERGSVDLVEFFLTRCGEDPGRRTKGGIDLIRLAGTSEAVKRPLLSTRTEVEIGHSLPAMPASDVAPRAQGASPI
jgi:ankyrin repeat protein